MEKDPPSEGITSSQSPCF